MWWPNLFSPTYFFQNKGPMVVHQKRRGFPSLVGWDKRGQANTAVHFWMEQHVINLQVSSYRGRAYLKLCLDQHQCLLTTACVCGGVKYACAGFGCEYRAEVPWGPAGLCLGTGPTQLESCPASEREDRDRQQLNLSHTSKGPDRIHKSTVAVQIRGRARERYTNSHTKCDEEAESRGTFIFSNA